MARAHPGAVSPWSQAVPPTTARRFLPPRSLETRTSLSHPRSPPCARAQQMGGRAGAFRAERGSNELSRSVRGPQLRPGCRKRPRGHQRHSFLACPQTCSSRASLLGQVASDLRLFAPRQRRSSGNTEWGGSRAARHMTPRPQVPAARPRPLPTCQIIQSQQMSPHLPAGRTLRSLAGQGPRTVDGWVEPSSGEERAAATATTSRCSGRLSAGCRVTKNASRVVVMLAAATRRVLACTRPRARRSACPTPRLTLTATLRGKDGSPHFTDGNSEAEKGEVAGPRSQHQCLGGRVERRVRSTPCWTRAREGGAVNPDGPSPLELTSPPHLSFGRNLSHTLTWARFPGGFREGPTRDVKRLPHRREIATCHLDDCAS